MTRAACDVYGMGILAPNRVELYTDLCTYSRCTKHNYISANVNRQLSSVHYAALHFTYIHITIQSCRIHSS